MVPIAPVVLTFSEAMERTATRVQFVDLASAPPASHTVTIAWNDAGTELTCTPNPPFPAYKRVTWSVEGQNPAGEPLVAAGAFNTGPNAGDVNTNSTEAILLSWTTFYRQTDPDHLVLSTSVPYTFWAAVRAASNEPITAVTLQLPSRTITNLNQYLPNNWYYYLSHGSEVPSDLYHIGPPGGYDFAIAGGWTEGYGVYLALAPVGGPHITNFPALQGVDPNLPFTLGWDAIELWGPLPNYNYMRVEIGEDFRTPDFFQDGALRGTATSVTVPAGTLKPGSNYTARVSYCQTSLTGWVIGSMAAYNVGVTEFNLTTSPAVAPAISGPGWRDGRFSFDVEKAPDQPVTVFCSSNPRLPIAQWQVLLTTNNAASRVTVTDPRPQPEQALFYRVQQGQ